MNRILMHTRTYRRFDVAHACRKAAELGWDGIEVYGGDLNIVRDGDAVDFEALEGGALDYGRIFRHVRRAGYRGPICVEFSGNVDEQDVAAGQDIRFMRRLQRAAAGGETQEAGR